jgi:hypothetical protein
MRGWGQLWVGFGLVEIDSTIRPGSSFKDSVGERRKSATYREKPPETYRLEDCSQGLYRSTGHAGMTLQALGFVLAAQKPRLASVTWNRENQKY